MSDVPQGAARPDVTRERRGAAQRQRQRIEGLQRERTARLEILELLRSRRRQAGHFPFEIEEVRRGKDFSEVLRSPSELLAERRAVDDAEAAAVVEAAGFTPEFVECLRSRVVRLSRHGACRHEVQGLRTALRAKGVRVSMEYMTPNRVVMKAAATPEAPIEPPRSAPDPGPEDDPDGGPLSVVVIDNGVSSRTRDDGWLRGLQTDANTDPLDVFPRPNGFLDLGAGHGTFVAGLFQLTDPGLDLRILKVVDSDGIASEVDVACALVRAVEQGLRPGGRMVVNLSLGTETVDDDPPLTLETALHIVREVEQLRNGEVIVVAAAGNEGTDRPSWPAAFAPESDRTKDDADRALPRVVAVAALDESDEPACWSTHGPWVTCSAQGEAVVSTYVTGREDPQIDPQPETFGPNAWAYWTGTSFAAPQVAALVASQARRTGSSLAEALSRVLQTAERIDGAYGYLLARDDRRTVTEDAAKD